MEIEEIKCGEDQTGLNKKNKKIGGQLDSDMCHFYLLKTNMIQDSSNVRLFIVKQLM